MKNDNNDFDQFSKQLGKRITKLREKANLTQEEMAGGKHAIEYKYYQKIEYGQKNITMKTLFKICKKLNIQPKDLFDR